MEYLKYGLLNGDIIHINDVPSGLACNCLCPNCKSQLIARKGQKKPYHFAHYKLADCNHGTESALHLMAKNIIAQTKKLFVPYVPKDVYDSSNMGEIVVFESSTLEKQISDTVRSDVLLYTGNTFLNVEIKVTHEVDMKKRVELFNLGIPTIEINLSDIKSDFTSKIIEERLINGKYTELIFSPKAKDIFSMLVLGEWKTVYNNDYVKDCPISRKRAYFFDYDNKGGSCECHECYMFSAYKGGDNLLCMGILDELNFNDIEKILSSEKEENHIRHVKLLMTDGRIIER